MTAEESFFNANVNLVPENNPFFYASVVPMMGNPLPDTSATPGASNNPQQNCTSLIQTEAFCTTAKSSTLLLEAGFEPYMTFPPQT